MFTLLFIWEIVPSAAVLIFFRNIPATEKGCLYKPYRALRLRQMSGDPTLSCPALFVLALGRCCGCNNDTGLGLDTEGAPYTNMNDSGFAGAMEGAGDENILVDDSLGSITTYGQPGYRSTYVYSQGPGDSYYLYSNHSMEGGHVTPPVLPGSANSRVAMPYRSAVLDSPMSGVTIGMGNNYAYAANAYYDPSHPNASVAIPGTGQPTGVVPGSVVGAGGVVTHSVHSMTASHMPQLSGLNISHHGGSLGRGANVGSLPTQGVSHYSYDGYAAQY